MSSTCVSSCVRDARVPIRATYANLYKWPESDAAFVKSLSTSKDPSHGTNSMYEHPRVVESFSCRQLYLRSYVFSRQKDDRKKTVKGLGKPVNDKEERNSSAGGGGGSLGGGGRKCMGLKRAKVVSCAALKSVFRRLLSCSAGN